jgi:hypothetical protein
VVPGELPSPGRLTRLAEHLEAVPVRIEEAGGRRGQRPQHVLHRHHRDDLGVPGQAGTGDDQLVPEPALVLVERADRQPGPVPRRQEGPVEALIAEREARLLAL